MQPIIDLFTSWQGELATLGPIVAGVGVVLWFIIQSLSGIMPEWSQNARGWVQRILLGAVVVGLAPALITSLMALGG